MSGAEPMNVLLTGSSGWLGQTLAPSLLELGHRVLGLDPNPGPFTQVQDSIADAALVRELVFDMGRPEPACDGRASGVLEDDGRNATSR